MAFYYEDWSGSTVGNEPTGWTKRWGTSNTAYEVLTDGTSPTGRVLRITKTTASQRAVLSMNAVDSDSDRATVRVRALVRRSTTASSSSVTYGGVSGRASGTLGNETGLQGSFGTPDASTNRDVRVNQYLNNTPTGLTTTGTAAWPVNEWFWIGLDLVGTDQTAATRSQSDPFTTINTLTRTTDVTAAGWVGIWSFGTFQEFDVAMVTIATGSDAAFYSDVSAPTLSSPTGTQTGTTTANLSVSTNRANGTLYWVVTTSATSPSAAQVQAGQDHTGSAAVASGNQAVTETGVQNAGATSLTAATTYYAHFYHETVAGNDSNVSTSASFTTASSAVKGLRVRLYDGATAQASLTGISVAMWAAQDFDATAPDFYTATATTDADGWLEVDVDAVGGVALNDLVYTVVWKRDTVTVADSLGFQGVLTVSDIS